MDYDLLITTNVSSTFQYQCQVTIQHHTEGSNTITYGGPVAVLEKLGMIYHTVQYSYCVYRNCYGLIPIETTKLRILFIFTFNDIKVKNV